MDIGIDMSYGADNKFTYTLLARYMLDYHNDLGFLKRHSSCFLCRGGMIIPRTTTNKINNKKLE